MPSEFEKPVPDDRVVSQPAKGRGTTTRILHRFNGLAREAQADGLTAFCGSSDQEPSEMDEGQDNEPEARRIETVVTLERARSILSRNDSPDLPFDQTINVYRGCEHGCIYCYARPTHSYLNLSPGLDFETQLVAKVNAVALLRRELAKPSYVPSPINLGAATDPYQPIEREHRLTRGVIEVLLSCRHPFTIVTKSSGVERDLDLLVEAAKLGLVYVMVSITTLDGVLCRKLEPRAAAPLRRLQTVKRLAEAGVPVAVNVAPIIPFLNEPEIERIVEQAALAGASRVNYTVLRLPWEVKPLFEEWLAHHAPQRAARIMARLKEMRGGKAYDSDFSLRMRGQGIWADLIRQRLRKAAARHGVNKPAPVLDVSLFDRSLLYQAAEDGPQQSLF